MAIYGVSSDAVATGGSRIGKWNGHKFLVSPERVHSFNALTISGGSNFDTKTGGKQDFVSRTSGRVVEISLTVELYAVTGCKVRSEAIALVKQARAGKKGYFYLGTKKLMACKLMLTDASVNETVIGPKGAMTEAKVSLTFQQCSKNNGKKAKANKTSGGGGGGGGGKSGGGSGKISVRTNQTPTSQTPTSQYPGPHPGSAAANRKPNAAQQAMQHSNNIRINAQNEGKPTGGGGGGLLPVMQNRY